MMNLCKFHFLNSKYFRIKLVKNIVDWACEGLRWCVEAECEGVAMELMVGSWI